MGQCATATDRPVTRRRTCKLLGLALLLITLTLALPTLASASSSTRGWGGWTWHNTASVNLNGVAFAG